MLKQKTNRQRCIVCRGQFLLFRLEVATLAELNETIRHEFNVFDARPFQKRDGSRTETFKQQDEKSARAAHRTSAILADVNYRAADYLSFTARQRLKEPAAALSR